MDMRGVGLLNKAEVRRMKIGALVEVEKCSRF